MSKKIAITCGDPAGLGPELIEACLSRYDFPGSEFVVVGDNPWLQRLLQVTRNPVEAVPLSDRAFELGKPEPDGAKLAMAAMEEAARRCSDGDCEAVVTGPISKALCAAVGYAYPGQTEFFADRWGGEPTMCFVGQHLKVTLATWHIPLAAVPQALDEAAIRRSLASAIELGQRNGIERPRILVCGLNPHAGEGGMLGTEERDWINDLILRIRDEADFPISGCIPGDTAFSRAMKGEADVVVALYHDQGLAPFKAVDFESGVNVTLGLPHLRVSPDHGTGFEIAGQGIASPGSFLHAIKLAVSMRAALSR